MPNVSVWEILLLLLVVLLVFGPKKLPEMGRSLGRGMREFKDSISGLGHASEPAESEPPDAGAEVVPVAEAAAADPSAPAPVTDAPKQPAVPVGAPVVERERPS